MSGFGRGGDGDRRVLLVLHNPLLNGASISALRAVPLLSERGWSFSFWVPTPGPAFDWLQARGADLRAAPRPIASGLAGLREPPGLARRLRATPAYLRQFRAALADASPDVVHANSLFSFAEAMSARRNGRPTVLHVHDMSPSSWKARPAAWICRRRVDVSIAVSEACARSYASDGWTPVVVHEAAPVPEEPARTRDDPRPFVIGTVGVIARRKGMDVFVEAARRVRARTSSIEFRMIGSPDDPLDREWGLDIVERARAAGVRHVPQADVNAALREWDAFALASRIDPCPIALLEAMALGLPVIGARTDGIPEEITPECGLLVAAGDADSLASAMMEVAGLPAGRRRAMGGAGRARVGEVFSLERQADGIERAYEGAIAAHRRP
jgi:glycosyltransferase involved in cell wall biosynthesis